ncbi:heme o synthase [Gammaproteobacteria bacterium]|nr:heme o synthase [Gammaproteobacteria bacterium]
MSKALLLDYFELCKPKVVFLMIITSLVGMCLAISSDSSSSLIKLITANIGITLVSFAAAVFNHVADQHIDKLMHRTKNRPIAVGKISKKNSLIFAIFLCSVGMFVLIYFVNTLTALLSFFALVGYAVFYTLYLKHATSQNIVIGGLAGASPPLLGWTSITGSISYEAIILTLIIFVWTPPHFWALAIHRVEDYAKAKIPMLPNTHGVNFTKLNIVLYTIILFCVSLLPFIIKMSGILYLCAALAANFVFLYYALKLYFSDNNSYAFKTFKISVYYLGFIFLFLLLDHYN